MSGPGPSSRKEKTFGGLDTMEGRWWDKKDLWNTLSIFLAIFIPIFIPVLNMLNLDILWGPFKKPVIRSKCNCACFDTIFRGAYESGVSPGYKHAYFNSTLNTLKIWTLTVIFVVFLYSSFQRLFSLLFTKQLRWSMGIILLSTLYSLFYVWWCLWNYWNDDYLILWNRQWFFAVTQVLSLILIVILLDKNVEIQPLALLIITAIAILQGTLSLLDQFGENERFEIGYSERVIRNVVFMTSDVVICGLSLFELRIYAFQNMGVGLIIFLRQRYIIIFSVTLFVILFMLLTML